VISSVPLLLATEKPNAAGVPTVYGSTFGEWNGRSLTDVMFTIASNTPTHLGIGKESVPSKPLKAFPYVPVASKMAGEPSGPAHIDSAIAQDFIALRNFSGTGLRRVRPQTECPFLARSGPRPQHGRTSAIWLKADLCTRQTLMGGRVNSRWLQAPDLDLFSGFSLVVEPRSV
jgi:hypothetical protein